VIPAAIGGVIRKSVDPAKIIMREVEREFENIFTT
jgi:hypothetical protein